MLKSLCLALKLCSTLSGYAHAIDGDTLTIEGYHVRLWGLDAEELNEPHGIKAKQSMALLLQSPVHCNLTGVLSYKRYMGKCTNDSGDIARQLVTNGAALDCAHYSGGYYRPYEPATIRLKLIQKPYC